MHPPDNVRREPIDRSPASPFAPARGPEKYPSISIESENETRTTRERERNENKEMRRTTNAEGGEEKKIVRRVRQIYGRCLFRPPPPQHALLFSSSSSSSSSFFYFLPFFLFCFFVVICVPTIGKPQTKAARVLFFSLGHAKKKRTPPQKKKRKPNKMASDFHSCPRQTFANSPGNDHVLCT